MKENQKTKLCKHCKTEIPAGAKICPNCKKKQGGVLKWIIIGTGDIAISIRRNNSGTGSRGYGRTGSHPTDLFCRIRT